jgi:hypothetical protein
MGLNIQFMLFYNTNNFANEQESFHWLVRTKKLIVWNDLRDNFKEKITATAISISRFVLFIHSSKQYITFAITNLRSAYISEKRHQYILNLGWIFNEAVLTAEFIEVQPNQGMSMNWKWIERMWCDILQCTILASVLRNWAKSQVTWYSVWHSKLVSREHKTYSNLIDA